MRTIQIAFVTAVTLPALYATYLVSDMIPLWSRRVMALAGLGVRVCGGLLVLVVLVACAYVLMRQQYERNRQRDGAFALREYWLEPLPRRAANWLLGRPSARAVYDPNGNIAHAAVIHATVLAVEPAGGWDRQLSYQHDIERTRRAQAVAPGDGVLGLPWFGGDVRGGIANAATGRLLAGAYDRTPKPPVVVDAPPPAALPQLPPPADLTPQAAIAESRPASLVLGQTDAGELVRWDMARVPHLRFHGATQGAGKTNAIQVVAAGALRTGAHVVVFDPARFKDWNDFAHCAELVDATDPAALADGAARLLTIYHNRTAALAETGARNIGEMARPPRRVVVVVCEFGAQCELARAEGVMPETETNLLQLARKGAAAGIHLVLEDQAVVRWPRALSANVAGVAIGQMPLYSAQACGFVPRRGMTTETLQPGQFWYGGQLLRTPHMQPALRTLLADVPAPRRLVMDEPRWVEGARSARSVTVAGEGLPEVDATEQPAERLTEHPQPNAEPTGPTDLQAAVWEWRDAHPQGTQAELRREFEARGITIARSYVFECWHDWPDQRLADFTAGRLTEAQISALWAAGLLSVSGGPLPGTERIEWNGGA